MLPDKIIEPGSLTIADDRVGVSIRMPWYRALPLSSVADLALTIDGVPVTRESITWTVNGTAYALDDLPPLHDEWWYVLDSVLVAGELPSALRQAQGNVKSEAQGAGNVALSLSKGAHDVQVVLDLYIPYITTDFGVLKISETDRKRVEVAA